MMPGAMWTCSALSCYGLAGALYLGFLGGLEAGAATWARLALGVALILHIGEISALALAGYHPVSSAQSAIGFSAFLLALGYFTASWRRRSEAVGALVAPTAFVMLLAARLAPGASDGPAAGLGVLGRIHISLAIVGTAVYASSAAMAALYLFEERQLKRRQVTALVRKGVAIVTLDRLLHRSAQVGFPLFTTSISAGVAWNARRGLGLHPEYAFAVVAWAALAVLLAARARAGWGGRRAAWLALLGFSASVTVLGIYLVRRAMGG